MFTPYELQKIANKCAILANPYDYTLNNKIITQVVMDDYDYQSRVIQGYKEFIDSLYEKIMYHTFKDETENHKFYSSEFSEQRHSSNYKRYDYIINDLSLHLLVKDNSEFRDPFRINIDSQFANIRNLGSNSLLFRQFNNFEINLEHYLRLKNSDVSMIGKDSYYLQSLASFNTAKKSFQAVELEAMFTFGLLLKESLMEELAYLLTDNAKLSYTELKQKLHVYNLLDSISKKEDNFNVINSYNNSFNLTSQFFEFIAPQISSRNILVNTEDDNRLQRWKRLFNIYENSEYLIYYANKLEQYVIYYIEILHILLHKMSKPYSQIILDLFRINADNKFLATNIYNPYTGLLNPEVEEIIAIKENEKRFDAIKTYLNSNSLKTNISKECKNLYELTNKIDVTSIIQIQKIENDLNKFTFPPFVAKFVMTSHNYAITRDAVKTAVIVLEYIKVNKIEVTEQKDYNISEDMLAALESEESQQTGFKDPFNDQYFDESLKDQPLNKKENSVSLATELDNTISSFKEKGHEFTLKEVKPSENAKSLYLAVSQKIKLLNSLLIKQIRDIKTYNQGSKLSGLSQGKIDSKNLYKYNTSDNLFYSNKYEIKESDLAFGIILDASGSMNGDKIADGKVSMVLLHETLRALNINHAIIDHTAKGHHSCIIRKYHDFKESKNYDISKSYGIMDIVSREGNNDAGALYYMEQALLKTHNKDKICIIFSDGEPTECSEKELKDQVKSMERKGIKVIGIGINLPKISEYYTDYANGRNLSEMIKIITDILRRYVLEK